MKLAWGGGGWDREVLARPRGSGYRLQSRAGHRPGPRGEEVEQRFPDSPSELASKRAGDSPRLRELARNAIPRGARDAARL